MFIISECIKDYFENLKYLKYGFKFGILIVIFLRFFYEVNNVKR